MRVKVAIDLALDRLFTYRVPEELEKKLAVGQLLSVPFGHRSARAFAMELLDGEGEEPYRLKDVAAIVDESPFFTPELLELVKRVAAYTASAVESVLKTALPAAVLKKNAKARELFFIEPSGSEPASALSKREQWIFEQIVRLGGGFLSQLCRELNTTAATLRNLAGKGCIEINVKSRRRDPMANCRVLPSKPLPLNDCQRHALETVAGADKPVLLRGITGSGKTEVYLQAIAAELAAGRGAIVMVPEIALTPQTVQRFASRFGDKVAVLHSALSDGERYDEWHRIRAGEARVVVGPRSAVWAPVSRLGLIVVDEEHETSYKQDESPRYHARDVAVLRAAVENARVVLGSATPSLESWFNAQNGKYALAEMDRRAGMGTLPAIRLVEKLDGSIFSKELLEAIDLRLARGEQTMLFLNRRGYARSMVCDSCGYVETCPECDFAYTYHRDGECLRCHICGGWRELRLRCPKCSGALSHKGIGTQRAEAALRKCFPKAGILRMDADSTSRKNSHADILGAFRRREADILLGTQMIAKGLDFPNVTLVGVLNADSSLMMSDFRAEERTFQLLSQVAGRAGRAELPGEVVIQSRDPSQNAIVLSARGDYAAFAAAELKNRRDWYFPPYCRLSVIGMRSKDSALVESWAEMYSASLKAYAKAAARQHKRLEVGDAAPSAVEKADGYYRWQIVLRSDASSLIVKAWRWIAAERPPPKTLIVNLDVDAFNLV